jgi:hypothetical protein
MSRNFISAIVISGVLAGFAFGQHRGGARTFGSSHGFGNILYPGTGNPPPLKPPGPFFGQQLGRTVAGFPPAVGRGRGHNRGGAIFVPVPVYAGYPYQQYPQQPVVVMQAPPQNQPQVVINNNFGPETARPVMRGYKEGDFPPAAQMRSYEAPGPVLAPVPDKGSTIIEDKATIYLIVYKDQSVHPSLAYWTKDDTLHYITLQGTHNRVSIDLVDAPYSEQLNRDRKVEFSLTEAK